MAMDDAPDGAQVSLQFYDREKRAAKGWLGSTLGAAPDDRQFWEAWCLTLAVTPPAPSQQQLQSTSATGAACCTGQPVLELHGCPWLPALDAPSSPRCLFAHLLDLATADMAARTGGRRARLQARLEEIITLIVRTVNNNKDHIPPVVNNSVLPFPYELKIGQCAPCCLRMLICRPQSLL